MTSAADAAIDDIYECAMDPSRWPLALQKIADCFGDVGCVLLYSRTDGHYGVIQSPSLDHVAKYYADGWSNRDIRAIRSRERGYFFGSDVITDRDVVTEEEMLTEPFYSEFLARFGLKYFAASVVSPDRETEVAVSVQRRADKLPYSNDELSLLATLGRHVERSLRLGMRLLDAELVQVSLAQALDRLDAGVFVIDALGRVIFSNHRAESLIGDGIELFGEDRKLRFISSNEVAIAPASSFALESFYKQERPLQIHRNKSHRPLTAYFLPVPSVNAPRDFLGNAKAIVLILDPVGTPLEPSAIRDLLGLTLAESKVAALIGSGIAPRDAAAKLGIAEDTVRKALNSIFGKTGISRQTELVSLLSRVALKAHD